MTKQDQNAQNIKVYVRVRPLNNDERLARSASIVACNSNRDVSVQEKAFSHSTKEFKFDRVFNDASKQADVFKVVAKPLIEQVLEGYNCTVFAYGQTGTGKTHTMEGIKEFEENARMGDIPADAGIIPRSLHEIFDWKLRTDLDNNSFQIKVSFLELYNEEIFDLLSKGNEPNRGHKMFEDKKGSAIVQGLEERVVESKNEVLRILEEGSRKRTTAATKMNASSSRSHTIFTIIVTKTERTVIGQEKFIEGKLNLVDLAGSENVGRSGAVDQRRREAGKINESLLTLGRVINSLVKKETHKPYRDSKLTRLLKDSLGGRTKTSIIATVSPAAINVEETLSTLDYAHRAKDIKNRPEVNQKISMASKLQEMHAVAEKYRRELEEQRDHDGGVFISMQRKAELEQKMLELEHVRKEFRDLSELFDLKTSENEKLSEELSDTLRRYEEQSVILQTTQEEKEVQEHLVERHAATETKIRGQAFELLEVADQQYSDLDLLHISKDRKSKLSEHNKKMTNQFEQASNSGLARLIEITDARSETQNKLCGIVREQTDQVLKENEDFIVRSVEDLAQTDAEVKQVVNDIDTITADHMHEEQKFLQATLKESQDGMNSQSVAFQGHLTKTLGYTQSLETETQRQHKALETMVSQFKQHVSQDTELTETFQTFLGQIMLAAGKKQDNCYMTASGHTGVSMTHLSTLESRIKEQIQNTKAFNDKMIDQIREQNKAQLEAYESLLNEASLIKENVNSADKQHSESVTATKAFIHTVGEKASALVNDKQELNNRALSEVSTSHETLTATIQESSQIGVHVADTVKSFVTKAQDEGKTRYDTMETKFRLRSDAAPKQLQDLQSKTMAVQKLNSDSLQSFESKTETHKADLLRWHEETLKYFDDCCQSIADLDSKLRDEVDVSQQRQSKFFKRDLRNDQPSGKTPSRVDRTYPKQIVEGTPDPERITRYKRTRNMAIPFQLDEDDEDNDSLISAVSTSVSTDMGEGDNKSVGSEKPQASQAASAKFSRQKSKGDDEAESDFGLGASRAPSEVSKTEKENYEPKELTQMDPPAQAVQSKLRAPKNYHASGAPQTRSSSRVRTPLTPSSNRRN